MLKPVQSVCRRCRSRGSAVTLTTRIDRWKPGWDIGRPQGTSLCQVCFGGISGSLVAEFGGRTPLGLSDQPGPGLGCDRCETLIGHECGAVDVLPLRRAMPSHGKRRLAGPAWSLRLCLGCLVWFRSMIFSAARPGKDPRNQQRPMRVTGHPVRVYSSGLPDDDAETLSRTFPGHRALEADATGTALGRSAGAVLFLGTETAVPPHVLLSALPEGWSGRVVLVVGLHGTRALRLARSDLRTDVRIHPLQVTDAWAAAHIDEPAANAGWASGTGGERQSVSLAPLEGRSVEELAWLTRSVVHPFDQVRWRDGEGVEVEIEGSMLDGAALIQELAFSLDGLCARIGHVSNQREGRAPDAWQASA